MGRCFSKFVLCVWRSVSARTKNKPDMTNSLEITRGKNDCFLICDYGSPEPASFALSLDFLKNQPWNADLSVILGFSIPAGTDPGVYYREIGLLLRRMELKHVVCFGADIEAYRYAFPKLSLLYNHVDDALADIPKFDFHAETVLIKSPETFSPRRIEALMQRRVHDTILTVSLNAIRHNLSYLRAKMNDGVRTMCMVKAKSYGLGDTEIATVLQQHRVDYLGVAYVDEGVNLRRWGIRTPVIVMNPERSSISALIKNRLEPEIYSLRVLEQFVAELDKFRFPEPYPIHIKLDTGMHRLGFSRSQLPALTQALEKIPSVRVASIFSHLVAAEDPREEAFTLGQIELFEQMSSQLIASIGYRPLRHILNTAGLTAYGQYQYDMVRLGLGLYGYSPLYAEQKKLAGCATLSTVISQIRELEPGETVSYNRRYRVKNVSHIATLPIGYADGISRLWGNGNGYVQINGMKAPIVGSICMDMMMADVTGIPCREGDTAVLIGDYPSPDEIAEATGTIPYEVLTNISDRVKRIYTLDIQNPTDKKWNGNER